MKELSDFKISDYCLVMDILGTTNRMSNPNYYADSLLDLLKVVASAYHESTNMLAPEDSTPIFQFGDTIVFACNDTEKLVSLGCRLLTKTISEGILLQGCISGGELYHVGDLTNLEIIPQLHPGLNSLLVFGLGPVSAFSAMKGIHGPRLVLNEEQGGIRPSQKWHHYMGSYPDSSSKPKTSVSISDVRWWDNLVDPESLVDNLIRKTNTNLTAEINYL